MIYFTALRCIECFNVRSNEECLEKGRMVDCLGENVSLLLFSHLLSKIRLLLTIRN